MIAALLAAFVAGAGPVAPPALAKLDADSMALLAKEAERTGVAARPEIAKRLAAERTRLAAEQYLSDQSGATPPSDADVRAALHATADSAKLQVVVLGQREEARAALARLQKGASLAEESKASVEPLARTKGGELGWVTARAIPPEVSKDVFAGPIGTWQGPYDVGGKFFLVKVLDRKAVDDRVADASMAEARARLTRERQDAARASLVAELRAKAGLQVDQAFLAEVVNRPEVTAKDRERAVATATGVKVTYGEVADGLGPAAAHAQMPRSPAMLAAIATQIADRRLVEQAAKKAGYEKNASVLRAYAPVKNELLSGAWWDDVATRTPAPSAAEVEAWYRSHAADFAVPAGRRCAHLVVATEEDARKARAAVLGGKPFEVVARNVTLDRETKERGGDLGTIDDKKLSHLDSAVSKAILALPPGAVSDPVQGKQGWHLFTCQPVPAHQLPLAEVQDRIAAQMRAERISAAVNGKLAELRKAAPGKKAKGEKGKGGAASKPGAT